MACPTPHGLPEQQDLASRPLPNQVFIALHQVMQSNRQLIARKLGEHGAHPGQTFCLRELAHDEGITQRDLAERLHVKPPTVTVMLQKMEKAGLIERRADEHDQRYTHIYLTESGRKLHADMHDMLDQMVDEVIGRLAEHDQKELVRLLGAMNQNILEALGDSGPESIDPHASLDLSPKLRSKESRLT